MAVQQDKPGSADTIAAATKAAAMGRPLGLWKVAAVVVLKLSYAVVHALRQHLNGS